MRGPGLTPFGADQVAHLLSAFWQAATELAEARGWPAGDPEAAAGAALAELATIDAETELRAILRPDPSTVVSRDRLTWTVTCFEMGNIAPAEVQELGNACEAIRKLTSCEHDSHVAAELICTDLSGIDWVAAVRSGRRVAFQMPDPGNLSGPDPATAATAMTRWLRHARSMTPSLAGASGHEPDVVIDLTGVESRNAAKPTSLSRSVAGVRSVLRTVGTIAATMSTHRTSSPAEGPATESPRADVAALRDEVDASRSELRALIEQQAATIVRLETELMDHRARIDGPPTHSVIGSPAFPVEVMS